MTKASDHKKSAHTITSAHFELGKRYLMTKNRPSSLAKARHYLELAQSAGVPEAGPALKAVQHLELLRTRSVFAK
ncbi:hypothetical protein GCM10017044_16640 [Kordiimonas sediminis]|uniref:Uncharacterized protein n=1 Tax=Kordiimonas sediminis TaxID=1735581 RepID=A0A919ASJ1_9PROT|nr:hypothetical protein [Kordiimonas sediminis]GHF22920.1 hypothetical protein GCM10017044_16640 [Kordiimonas sediminis]